MSKIIGLAIILLSAGVLLCVAGLLINDFRQDQEIEELRGQIDCSKIDDSKVWILNNDNLHCISDEYLKRLKEPLTQ